MGLFSSKKKTTVGTSVVRALEDVMIPNAIRDGNLNSIFNSVPIDEAIMDSLQKSVAIKSNQYYRYGNNGYFFGTPKNEYLFSTHGVTTVADVLSKIEKSSVDIIYYRIGDINYEHWLREFLLNYPPFNRSENTVTIGKEKKNVRGVQIHVPPNIYNELSSSNTERLNTSDSWFSTTITFNLSLSETKHTQVIPGTFKIISRNTPSGAVEAFLETTGINRWVSNQTALEKLPVAFPDDSEDTYINVHYSVGNKLKYKTFRLGEGKYPEIDNLLTESHTRQVAGQFYPMAYFRLNKTNLMDRKDHLASSKKLVKMIGLKYEEVSEQIHKDRENVKDVEQALLFMGVSALPSYNSPAVNEYTFEFIKHLYNSRYKVSRDSHGNIKVIDPPKNGVAIENPRRFTGLLNRNSSANSVEYIIKDKAYRIGFSASGITRSVLVGRVAPIGKYTKPVRAYTPETRTMTTMSIGDSEGREITYTVQVPHIKYRKQISSQIYEEYQVHEMRMVQYIYGKHTTSATLYKDIENLLIPIDRTILNKMGLAKREQVISYGMNFIFNSRVVTKVKWYQRGFFKTFLKVAAIAITIYSLGTGLSAAMAASAVATTATALAVMKAILTSILINIAISVGAKLVAKIFGEEFAIIAAVIAAVVSMSGKFKTTNWGKHLQTASTGLIKASNQVLQQKFHKLQTEFDDFVTDVKSKTEELNELTKSMMEGNHQYLVPIILPGEDSNAFYTRTVKAAGRPDLLLLEHKYYYKHALSLPTLSESLRGQFNTFSNNNNFS